MSRIILGVDPGLGGALAFLPEQDQTKLAVFDMPLADGAVCAPLLRDMIAPYAPEIAIIERVASRPGQGVSSSFNFGVSFGLLRGVLGARGVRVELVPPTRWKRHYRLSSDKEEARAAAIRIFPQRAELFARKKDDGRAEAALIALWGLDNLSGLGS